MFNWRWAWTSSIHVGRMTHGRGDWFMPPSSHHTPTFGGTADIPISNRYCRLRRYYRKNIEMMNVHNGTVVKPWWCIKFNFFRFLLCAAYPWVLEKLILDKKVREKASAEIVIKLILICFSCAITDTSYGTVIYCLFHVIIYTNHQFWWIQV